MPDNPNPQLAGLYAQRERLKAKLARTDLTPDARRRAEIHLKGNGLAASHADYCEGVEEAISKLEGKK